MMNVYEGVLVAYERRNDGPLGSPANHRPVVVVDGIQAELHANLRTHVQRGWYMRLKVRGGPYREGVAIISGNGWDSQKGDLQCIPVAAGGLDEAIPTWAPGDVVHIARHADELFPLVEVPARVPARETRIGNVNVFKGDAPRAMVGADGITRTLVAQPYALPPDAYAETRSLLERVQTGALRRVAEMPTFAQMVADPLWERRDLAFMGSAAKAGLKHGPRGEGGPGPCDADCRKCGAEHTAAKIRTPHGDIEVRADPAVAPGSITFVPRDPLDVAYDGVPLRELLERDERRRRERPLAFLNVTRPTPVQRAAISAHWSAQLRAKVAATAERERNQVRADLAVFE